MSDQAATILIYLVTGYLCGTLSRWLSDRKRPACKFWKRVTAGGQTVEIGAETLAELERMESGNE